MKVNFGSFFADRRGDKLASNRIVRGKRTGRYFVLLRGNEAVAEQVEGAFGCSRRRVPIPFAVEFTHCLVLPTTPSSGLKELLNLLTNVVSLPSSDDLPSALALDFYKDPTSSEDPMKWLNTPAGELVHRGKYHGSVHAGKQLVDELSSTIQRHPLYERADVIISVPGHRKSESSFGERLAMSVAKRTGKDLLPTTARSAERVPAKEGGLKDASVLADEFIVSSGVKGKHVIVIDDVIRSGNSMRAAAKRAKAMEAASVRGLAGVRTMRT